jgi:Leucine-rich repeat (LRR) protein
MKATKLMIERNLQSKSEVSKQFDIISEQLKSVVEECRINAPKVLRYNIFMKLWLPFCNFRSVVWDQDVDLVNVSRNLQILKICYMKHSMRLLNLFNFIAEIREKKNFLETKGGVYFLTFAVSKHCTSSTICISVLPLVLVIL